MLVCIELLNFNKITCMLKLIFIDFKNILELFDIGKVT